LPEAPSTRPVRDIRPTLQNAFRRIQMPRAFACSPCLARLRLNEYARDSRTRSPFTHRRSRQRIAVSFRLGHAPRLALRLPGATRLEMRPNRLLPPNTFSTTSTRASWVPEPSHQAFASRWTGDRAFHDARFASAVRAALLRGGALSSPDFPRLSTWATSRTNGPLAPLSRPRLLSMALAHASIVIRYA
jgi:hypothetical protein